MSDEVGDLAEVVLVEVGGEAVGDLGGDGWIDEEGGSDGDGGGASEQELEGVARVLDSAHADERDVCGPGDFVIDAVDVEEREGLDGGSAVAAGDVGEDGGAALDVDGECDVGIDKAEAVGAGVDGGARERDGVGDVGRELDDEGSAADGAAHLGDQFAQAGGVGSEHQAVGDVGAGDVEFDAGDSGLLIEGGGDVHIVVDGVAGDIDEHAGGHGLDEGQFFGEEALESDVGESNRIQQSGADFDDSRRLVSGPFMSCDALGGEAAQA